jgi:hypothetical protein
MGDFGFRFPTVIGSLLDLVRDRVLCHIEVPNSVPSQRPPVHIFFAYVLESLDRTI